MRSGGGLVAKPIFGLGRFSWGLVDDHYTDFFILFVTFLRITAMDYLHAIVDTTIGTVVAVSNFNAKLAYNFPGVVEIANEFSVVLRPFEHDQVVYLPIETACILLMRMKGRLDAELGQAILGGFVVGALLGGALVWGFNRYFRGPSSSSH